MKNFTVAIALASLFMLGHVERADAGCITGAVVGGVAGHMVGHGGVGAAAGCAVGHHRAATRARQRRAATQNDNGSQDNTSR